DSGEPHSADGQRSSESSPVTPDPDCENGVSEPAGGVGSGRHPRGSIVTPYTLVTTTAGLSAVVTAIENGGGLDGLDVETAALAHARERVRLVQLATARGTFLIDFLALPESADLTELFEALSRSGVVGHNLGFDLPFLMRHGFTPGRVYDTMLASQVLYAGD